MAGAGFDTTTRRETASEASSTSGCGAQLEIVHSTDSEQVGRRVALTAAESLVIGRASEYGVRIADARLSRSHLRIAWDPIHSGFRFADLNSANGTFKNGQPVTDGLLIDGDVLRIGDTLLVVEGDPERVSATSRAHQAARAALPLLILGETGVGKERVARAFHEASGRAGPFVAVNCGALPSELVSAELFGHSAGAFSGARAARRGLFRAASGGTLFLDEIADLPADAQTAVLRALQERRVRPVGTDTEVAFDALIVSATNRDLEACVREGKFRDDLMARLAQIVIAVPPLRQRRREILPLVREFAPELRVAASAVELLLVAGWPRNVRELRATTEALVAYLGPDALVQSSELIQHFPQTFAALLDRSLPATGTRPLADRRRLLERALAAHDGNIAAIARELGKPRSQIYRWLHSLGLLQRGRAR
jgi:DNA-binding NtrC family response regulator